MVFRVCRIERRGSDGIVLIGSFVVEAADERFVFVQHRQAPRSF
jgi:hypothetical protein